MYVGSGENHEGESFVGRLKVEPLVGGSAAMLHYTATSPNGRHLHREATLLATSHNGELCLWPVMEELPVVLPHPQTRRTLLPDGGVAVVFASGPREATETFREEITLEVKSSGEVVYAHSWGMPGGAFAERSSCALVAAET